MVRADLMDCIDAFCALAVPKPLGGADDFIGDLYQLPPVVTSYDREYFLEAYESPFF